jgi:hypothetical protein
MIEGGINTILRSRKPQIDYKLYALKVICLDLKMILRISKKGNF